MASRLTSDLHAAEDIAQEALLRAWRGRADLRDGAKQDAWLSQIVRHEVIREASRRRPSPVAEMKDLPCVDQALIAVEERDAFDRALGLLTPDEQELLRLRYIDDLTQVAISRRLSVPEGTVKVRLHRARAKLRQRLQEFEAPGLGPAECKGSTK